MVKCSEILEMLEQEWSSGSFLYDLRRNGNFDARRADEFLNKLRTIEFRQDEEIPKRIVSLLWYLPSFLNWQKERVAFHEGDTEAYSRFATEVHNTLEAILGVP